MLTQEQANAIHRATGSWPPGWEMPPPAPRPPRVVWMQPTIGSAPRPPTRRAQRSPLVPQSPLVPGVEWRRSRRKLPKPAPVLVIPEVKKCFEEHLEEFVTMFVRFNCLEVKADGDLGWAWQDVNQTFDGFQVHLLPVVPSWWQHAMVKLCPAAKLDVRVSYVVRGRSEEWNEVGGPLSLLTCV